MEAFNLGDTYTEKFVVTDNVINSFANFSSDFNPIHLDKDFAKSHGYSRQVSHGVIQLSFLSKMIGMNFPGPGSIWINQTVNWLSPVLAGDTIKILLTIIGSSSSAKVLTLSVEIFNQKNTLVMEGESQVKITVDLSNIQNFDKINPANKILSTNLQDTSTIENIKTNRVALVTGASRGIGEAIARRLSKNGFSVVINYRNDNKAANKIADTIVSSGGDAIAVQADITNRSDVIKMSNKVLNHWGRCDAVIHGASPPIKLIKTEEITYEDIDLYLSTYLKGAVLLVENFSKSMIQKQFGRFIFLGSSVIYGVPPKGMAAYTSAKEALWGYTKSLASDMAHYGITTNMVSPSLTITELTSEISARAKELEAMKSPVRRLVTVEDTAYHVAHLCADYSGYLNGINLPVTSTPI